MRTGGEQRRISQLPDVLNLRRSQECCPQCSVLQVLGDSFDGHQRLTLGMPRGCLLLLDYPEFGERGERSPELGRIAELARDLEGTIELRRRCRQLTARHEHFATEPTCLDNILGTVGRLRPAQALVRAGQRCTCVAACQPERSITVEEVLAVAPEHPSVVRAWVSNDGFHRLKLRLSLLQAAEREVAIAQVQPGVTSDLGIGGLDGVGQSEALAVQVDGALVILQLAMDPSRQVLSARARMKDSPVSAQVLMTSSSSARARA